MRDRFKVWCPALGEDEDIHDVIVATNAQDAVLRACASRWSDIEPWRDRTFHVARINVVPSFANTVYEIIVSVRAEPSFYVESSQRVYGLSDEGANQ